MFCEQETDIDEKSPFFKKPSLNGKDKKSSGTNLDVLKCLINYETKFDKLLMWLFKNNSIRSTVLIKLQFFKDLEVGFLFHSRTVVGTW